MSAPRLYPVAGHDDLDRVTLAVRGSADHLPLGRLAAVITSHCIEEVVYRTDPDSAAADIRVVARVADARAALRLERRLRRCVGVTSVEVSKTPVSLSSADRAVAPGGDRF